MYLQKPQRTKARSCDLRGGFFGIACPLRPLFFCIRIVIFSVRNSLNSSNKIHTKCLSPSLYFLMLSAGDNSADSPKPMGDPPNARFGDINCLFSTKFVASDGCRSILFTYSVNWPPREIYITPTDPSSYEGFTTLIYSARKEITFFEIGIRNRLIFWFPNLPQLVLEMD